MSVDWNNNRVTYTCLGLKTYILNESLYLLTYICRHFNWFWFLWNFKVNGNTYQERLLRLCTLVAEYDKFFKKCMCISITYDLRNKL